LIDLKHFAFLPELNYHLSHHDIKYSSESWAQAGARHSYMKADYSLYASSLQMSLMFKIKIGKRIKPYIGCGPYLNLPIFNRIDGQIETYGTNGKELLKDNEIKVDIIKTVGGFLAVGIGVPCKESNFGLEFRYYFCSHIIVEYFNAKQSFFAASFIYQLKSKKNEW
jgi:hypothetical protein